jgi:hypothetical protein
MAASLAETNRVEFLLNDPVIAFTHGKNHWLQLPPRQVSDNCCSCEACGREIMQLA